MPDRALNSLHRLLPRPALPVAAVAFVGLGLALGRVLAAVPEALLPDVTLRLAALLTLPLPPLALQLLTTPPNLATRRLLGETATGMTLRSRRAVLHWTLVAMLAPLTLAVTALVTGSPDRLHVAAALAGAIALTSGLSIAAMLHGLELLAGGRHAGWALVAGGGAFGPAESAPLLYLPAFALVGALVPVALLAAIWNARPELLTPTVWLTLPLAELLLGARLAMTSLARARPHLHAGLRAAEQAHATRFAHSDGLDEPPIWLTLGKPAPLLAFFARAWHRRWPLSGIVTVALGVATALLVGPDAPPWALFLTCAGFSAVAFTRVLALQDQPAWAASAWLGVDRRRRQQAYRRLGLGLTVPALTLAAAMLWRGHGGGLLGFACGLAVGLCWMAEFWRAPGWIRVGCWLTYGAGLFAAIVGAT